MNITYSKFLSMFYNFCGKYFDNVPSFFVKLKTPYIYNLRKNRIFAKIVENNLKKTEKQQKSPEIRIKSNFRAFLIIFNYEKSAL